VKTKAGFARSIETNPGLAITPARAAQRALLAQNATLRHLLHCRASRSASIPTKVIEPVLSLLGAD
jgi:hypothetical protein